MGRTSGLQEKGTRDYKYFVDKTSGKERFVDSDWEIDIILK